MVTVVYYILKQCAVAVVNSCRNISLPTESIHGWLTWVVELLCVLRISAMRHLTGQR